MPTTAAVLDPLTTPDPAFSFPADYFFPPFFTLQPNTTILAAQLRKWSALICAYCAHHRIFRLSLAAAATTITTAPATPTATATFASTNADPRSVTNGSPLFYNRTIRRRLDLPAIQRVIDWMAAPAPTPGRSTSTSGGGGVSTGGGRRAEWVEGSGKMVAIVWWRRPEEWAELVARYVDETGQRGSVLTLYELAEGEATRGQGLFTPFFYINFFIYNERCFYAIY